MSALIQTIASWFSGLFDWIGCFFTDFIWCATFNLFFDLVLGGVGMSAAALAWVPIPAAIESFVWPDAGPLAGVLFETGFGQATAILAAAFTLKFLLRLVPFVRL
jgi:hypothetical protein